MLKFSRITWLFSVVPVLLLILPVRLLIWVWFSSCSGGGLEEPMVLNLVSSTATRPDPSFCDDWRLSIGRWPVLARWSSVMTLAEPSVLFDMKSSANLTELCDFDSSFSGSALAEAFRELFFDFDC